MLIKEKRVKGRRQDNGNAHHEGNIDPPPHFINFFLDGMTLGFQQRLLVVDARANLLDGFRRHVGFRADAGNQLQRPTLRERGHCPARESFGDARAKLYVNEKEIEKRSSDYATKSRFRSEIMHRFRFQSNADTNRES
jgi:hypothetical protein